MLPFDIKHTLSHLTVLCHIWWDDLQPSGRHGAVKGVSLLQEQMLLPQHGPLMQKLHADILPLSHKQSRGWRAATALPTF